ncbi:MAG: 50S ribosomal protein L35 [candidate division Zixibacteria bacterium]|nr:50S ribosomal protein L35 [candidate division Zixibacteria bacterium]
MPKMKTKSGAAKRFKKTGSGHIKREKAFRTHKFTKMTPKRRRQLRKATLVSEADINSVHRMLPNA